jgi:hypothetical protein
VAQFCRLLDAGQHFETIDARQPQIEQNHMGAGALIGVVPGSATIQVIESALTIADMHNLRRSLMLAQGSPD